MAHFGLVTFFHEERSLKTIASNPTIDFEYDYIHSSSEISYTVSDAIVLLNYQDADGDEIQGVSIGIDENVENDAQPSVYVDGVRLSEGVPHDIFSNGSNFNFNSQLEIHASSEFSIIDIFVQAFDGNDWSNLDQFEFVSVEESVIGTSGDDTLTYVLDEDKSIIFDGDDGHDVLNLTVSDGSLIKFRNVWSDYDYGTEQINYIAIFDEIEVLNVDLFGTKAWNANSQQEENIIFNGTDNDVKLDVGVTDSFSAPVASWDVIDLTDNDFTEGVTVDVENGIVYRTGGYDYIDGFDGYLGTSKNDNFIGGNTGAMGWQQVLRYVNTQRPYDFDASLAETFNWFASEFNIVEIFAPGDGPDTIFGGDDGATVNYNWGYDFPENGIYSDLKEGIIVDPWGNNDAITNILDVVGTPFNDTFLGDDLNNRFWGVDGSDFLRGGLGVDALGYVFFEHIVVNLSDTKEPFADTNFRLENFLPEDFVSNYGSAGISSAVYTKGEFGEENLSQVFGFEALLASYGDDVILGDQSENLFLSFGGDDWVHGFTGNDQILSGAGNDTVYGGYGANEIFSGSGDDTIIVDGSSTFSSFSRAFNVSSSTQVGTEERISLKDMVIIEDVIDGGADTDTVQLGEGNIALFLHDAFSNFHSSMDLSTDIAGKENAARLKNIESIIGNDSDVNLIDLTSPDYSLAGQVITIDGAGGRDIIWGSDADETIIGGEGNDELFGGAGTNILTGGAGADEFQFTMSSTNDSVTDFNAAEGDTLTFFNTGGAEFDESSVSANSALDGITIEYSLDNQTQSLDISLGSETWNLFVQRDIILSVEII